MAGGQLLSGGEASTQINPLHGGSKRGVVYCIKDDDKATELIFLVTPN